MSVTVKLYFPLVFGLPVAVLVSLASHEPCREVERAQFVLRADGQSQVDVRLFGVGEYGPPAVDVEKVGGLVVYAALVHGVCGEAALPPVFLPGDFLRYGVGAFLRGQALEVAQGDASRPVAVGGVERKV